MQIAVLGGSGTAGTATVAELEARGHTVRVLARRTGFDVTDPSTFDDALAGIATLVDTLGPTKTSGPEARAVLVDGLAAVLDAAAHAGVKHVVSLSIVGSDRIPMPYYALKQRQEAVVRAAPLPSTILRATQFPELLDMVWSATRKAGIIPAPRGVVAPIDPRDVAVAIADAVERGPATGELIGIRGPETLTIRDLARTWKAARGSRRPVIGVPAVGGALRTVAGGALVDESLPAATRTWAEWLAEHPA
ncbi:MAG: NmrA family NAD(P)-binding protein [Solirubrobacteraceae bacterium]|nr:NmrA family NAD(P)-binding protein [Patulibacter sp.]